jgi:predicted PolB exonuclease-like 3'-5' exonuclease
MSSDEFSLDFGGMTGRSLVAEENGLGVDRDGHLVAEPGMAFASTSKQPTGQPLFFDIETIPNYEAIESFGLEPLPPIPEPTAENLCPILYPLDKRTVKEVEGILETDGVVFPGPLLDRYDAEETVGKNRDGVLKAIAKARLAIESVQQMHADRCKLLSVSKEYCQIASIATASGRDPVTVRVLGQGYTETELLEHFWAEVADGCLIVGFNHIHFDLPVVFWRSAMLGIEPTRRISLSKYDSNRDCLDLFLKLCPSGKGNMKGIAKLCGVKVPAGDVDGSKVAELFKTDPLAVGFYNGSDVDVTRGIYNRFRGFFWS